MFRGTAAQIMLMRLGGPAREGRMLLRAEGVRRPSWRRCSGTFAAHNAIGLPILPIISLDKHHRKRQKGCRSWVRKQGCIGACLRSCRHHPSKHHLINAALVLRCRKMPAPSPVMKIALQAPPPSCSGCWGTSLSFSRPISCVAIILGCKHWTETAATMALALQRSVALQVPGGRTYTARGSSR